MSHFMMSLDKCPKCGEYGVATVFHDWVGEACVKCDYEKRDEVETAKMLKENKEFMKWYKSVGK